MKEAPPNLVMQEPTATGWQRTEIYGDKDAGKKHLHAARNVLGALRSRCGVNERIAQGQAGGFYHQWATLADGTRVHAITNDGHDTVRIYPPGGKPPPEPPPPERKPGGKPYMWVGVRTRYDQCRASHTSACVNMVEPDGAEYRGTITNSWEGWCGVGAFDGSAEDGYMRRASYPGYPYVPDNWTIQDVIADHETIYNYYNTQPRKTLRDHNMWIEHVDDAAYFFCSANGLRLYGSAQRSGTVGVREDELPSERWGPYDPLMDDAQNGGEGRDVSGMVVSDFDAGNGLTARDLVRGWDHVFVLDPHESLGLAPCDSRPHILAASRMLAEAGMVQGESQVLTGEYMLTVQAYGNALPISERAGEVIEVEHNPTLGRGDSCDYIERIRPSDYTLPLVVEVEVRLGKMAQDDHPDTLGMSVFHFELTCADYHDGVAAYPFGYGDTADYEPCAGAPTFNPFGPNYSDVIAIDVHARSARLVAKSAVDLTPMFGGGIYKPLGDTVLDVDIYIVGTAEDGGVQAGQALWQVLEVMTSGAYGCSHLSEQTESQLIAICAGLSPSGVNLYDPVAHTLKVLPKVESTAAMRADPRYQWLWDWFYPYRKDSRSRCRHAMAIDVRSNGFLYTNGGPGTGPDDDNDMSQCCI